MELKGVTFSAAYDVDVQKVVSKNVVGILPGTKRPDETVIYTAHWDHLGVGKAIPKMGVWALPTSELALDDCFGYCLG